MRIIAGKYRGHKLALLRGKTLRPTSERLKESMFSSLGERVQGLQVLDLFAGTGSLGLEALSRGAEGVVFVEKSRKTQELIKKNCSLLNLEEEVLVLHGRAGWVGTKYLPRLEEYCFGMILLDPPYFFYQEDGFFDQILDWLSPLSLQEGCLFVFEHPCPASFPPHWTSWKTRQQGDKGWTIFQGLPGKI